MVIIKKKKNQKGGTLEGRKALKSKISGEKKKEKVVATTVRVAVKKKESLKSNKRIINGWVWECAFVTDGTHVREREIFEDLYTRTNQVNLDP